MNNTFLINILKEDYNASIENLYYKINNKLKVNIKNIIHKLNIIKDEFV